MAALEQLANVIETGNIKEVHSCISALLEQGVTPEQVVSNGFMPGLAEVGRKFDQGEYYITNMLLSARAVRMGYEILCPELGTSHIISRKKVYLGTVQGDLHNIGKNLVAMVMRGSGIEVVDLGVDVPPEQFVRAVELDQDAAYVGLSALLTTTIPAMRTTVKALRKSKAGNRIKIMVGGAPITAEIARDVGADIYTESAFEAADLIVHLLKEEGLK